MTWCRERAHKSLNMVDWSPRLTSSRASGVKPAGRVCCRSRRWKSAAARCTNSALRREGLLAPSEVRRVRKELGLTQKEAGLLLGGGRNAFQKYESAEVLTSQAISNLLRVLEKHPAALEVLRPRP